MIITDNNNITDVIITDNNITDVINDNNNITDVMITDHNNITDVMIAHLYQHMRADPEVDPVCVQRFPQPTLGYLP